MTDKIVVFNTCGSAAEAESLARSLVEKRLAACVNVIAPVTSYYRWDGAIKRDQEWLLAIKSSRPLFDAVRAAIEAAHSYDLPELIAVPIIEGSANYLDWLSRELQPPANIE